MARLNGVNTNNSYFVLIGLCVLGLILFALASVIVLSLIPIYLPAKGSDIDRITIRTTITPSTTATTATTATTSTNLLTSSNEDQGAGGRIVSATAANFPALIDNQIAMKVGFISACGINLPHIHPRANEINYIVSGQYETGFYQEYGGQFRMQTINAGQGIIFPQGSLHFEQNLSCEPTVFVAAFDSDDPGEQVVGNAFFGQIPSDITAASINTNITTIDDLKRLLPNNPGLGIQLCRQTLWTQINFHN